jgi:hypothetical protein
VSEAGIVVAKPRDWWRVPLLNSRDGAGSCESMILGGMRKHDSLGALVGGRRSAPWKSLLLTRVRRNRRWLFGTLGPFAGSRLAGARQRASEVGRQLGKNAVDNTAAR